MAIPRVIHYCWFGNGEKSELVKKCIASWRKYCPDCEIIEWNESNYDITKNQYMYQAYQAKRWGFATDYARLDIIYTYGGIYLDTDVELIKSIAPLFFGEGFIGFEKPANLGSPFFVNSGQGFGAPPQSPVIRKMLDEYDGISFINKDGSSDLVTCPTRNTNALIKLGLQRDNTKQTIQGFNVYPADYFCPLNWKTKKYAITENTYSIHHFNASWLSDDEKQKRKKERIKDTIIHLPNCFLRNLLGQERYDRLKHKLGR